MTRILSRTLTIALGCLLSLPAHQLVAQEVVEVHVSPTALALGVGQRERLFFSAFDADGNIAERPVYRLSTSNSLVARVEANGTVVGVAPGEAMLVVRAGQGSANVRVVVHGMAPGDSSRASAAATAAGMAGTSLPVDPDMASTVDRVLVYPAPSRQPITFPVGASSRFRVQALAADSLPAPVAITWTMSDSSVARFDRVTGMLLGTAVGTVDLTAMVPGIEPITWRVEVTPLALSLAGGPVTLSVGEAHQLRGVFRDVDGEPVRALETGRWTSSDPSAAVVDSTGRVSGVGIGSSTIALTGPDGDTVSTTVYVAADLVVAIKRGMGEGAGIYQVQLEHPDQLMPLLDDRSTNLYPAPTREHNAVVFTSDRGRGLYDLYLMNPDGSELRALTDAPGHHTQPVWTPEGSIVFTSTKSGTPHVYELTLGPDSAQARPLTSGERPYHSPAVSPDGATLAAVGGRGREARVFLMDRKGEGVRPAQIAEAGRWERAHKFFPNGDLAAIVQIGERATAVFRWEAARDVRVPLLTSDGSIRDFSISRDGRLLAAVIESTTDQERGTKLLIVNLEDQSSNPLALPLAPGHSVANASF